MNESNLLILGHVRTATYQHTYVVMHAHTSGAMIYDNRDRSIS